VIYFIAGLACLIAAGLLIVVARNKVNEDNPAVRRWQLQTLLPTSLLILLVTGVSFIVKGATGG
jgi:hypothetical protein